MGQQTSPMWGALQGALAGIGASLGGCIVGFIVGFLLNHLPRAVNVVGSRTGRKHALLDLLLVVSGRLIWLCLGFGFWWL